MADKMRLPHAILERNSRIEKAKKIVSLVNRVRVAQCTRILEVGCGSGVISHSLSTMFPTVDVFALDVTDSRTVHEGFQFSLVHGTEIPFPDAHFDLVITNHVMEHVGIEDDQLSHLREIKRVLSKEGLVYLAVPNRWTLLEPHYKLPILSWLPQVAADAYVRVAGRGTYYDCRPLGARHVESMFVRCGFEFQNLTDQALRETMVIEKPHLFLSRHIDSIPTWLTRLGMPIIPTLVYLLRLPTR